MKCHGSRTQSQFSHRWLSLLSIFLMFWKVPGAAFPWVPKLFQSHLKKWISGALFFFLKKNRLWRILVLALLFIVSYFDFLTSKNQKKWNLKNCFHIVPAMSWMVTGTPGTPKTIETPSIIDERRRTNGTTHSQRGDNMVDGATTTGPHTLLSNPSTGGRTWLVLIVVDS